MPYGQVDGYVVMIPDTGSAVVTALDDSGDSFAPVSIARVDSSIASANKITQLIDGTIAVTLVGDLPPSGTLVMIFTDDATMLQARAILARPTAFSLSTPARPALAMTFVRQGEITPGMHDQVRDLWEFSCGFQEVTP